MAVSEIRRATGEEAILLNSHSLFTKSEQKVAGDQPSGTTREAEPRSALATTANSDAAYSLFGFRNKNQLATIIYKSVT